MSRAKSDTLKLNKIVSPQPVMVKPESMKLNDGFEVALGAIVSLRLHFQTPQ